MEAPGGEPGHDDEAGFAAKMNAMPKFVVSRTLEAVEWNNPSLLQGDLADEVPRLKEQMAGEILVAGSRTLVHAPELVATRACGPIVVHSYRPEATAA